MVKYVLGSIFFLQLTSCQPRDNGNSQPAMVSEKTISDSTAAVRFFPVTDYLNGQINDIRLRGINPMIYVTKNKQVDSAWLKSEYFEKEMGPFLESVIDSANLTDLFTEKRFLDQTLNAYTFTYDPKSSLPDSVKLQHWDVYVDPTTNKLKRIYIIRKISDNKQQQLTWQSDKWCKIVTITTGKNNNSVVDQEVLIKWDF